MRKTKAILLLLMSMIICCFLGFAYSCKKDDTANKIVLDSTFNETYEYTGTAITLPTAHVEDDNGKLISYDVTYTIYQDDKDIESSQYSSFTLKVGAYKLVYSYGKLSLEKNFSIVDTTAPTIVFTGTVGSQFLQDMDNNTGFLPTADITDLSQDDGMTVDYNLVFTNADNVKTTVEFNKMNFSYTANEFGTYTYTVTATDAYDNSSTESLSWRIKDRTWQPSSVKDGYLADFDEEGYINYIEPGNVDQYYQITDITEDYLTEYHGESGVVKIVMGFNHAPDYGGYNSVRLTLPNVGQFTADNIKGKYLAIRMYIDDDLNGLLSRQMIWGGNIAEIQGDSVTKTEKYIVQGVQVGKWFTMYIDASTIAQLKMYNKDNTTCTQVQICFADDASLKGTNEHMTLYVAGIAIADKLPSQTGLVVSGNTATWDSIANATNYQVEMNGVTTIVTTTSIALDGTKGYIKVTPRVDGVTALDGDYEVATYGVDAKDYLALFNDDIYTNLVDSDTIDVNYQYYKIEKELTSEGLKLQLAANGVSGINTGFRLHLIEALNGTTADYLIIKLKVDNEKFTTLTIKDANGKTLGALSLEDKSGDFFEIKISLDSYDSTSESLQFLFGPATSAGAVTGGVEVVLQEIKAVTYLSIPVISDNKTGHIISWAAVEKATGYIISVDGVEQRVTDTQYNYTGSKGVFKVKAIGDSIKLVDSDYTTEYYFDARLDNESLTGFAYDSANKIISWTDIANKSKYEVKIGNDTIDATTNSFDYTNYTSYDTVYVRGVGTDTYRDTEWVELKIINDAIYEVEGSITITADNIGYATNSLIQLNGLSLDTFEGDASAGATAYLYGNVTINGIQTNVTASFFGNANKTFMISDLGEDTDKVLKLAANTVLYQGTTAYTIAEDVSLYYFNSSKSWCILVGDFSLKKTGWGTSSILQLSDVELPEFDVFDGNGETAVGFIGASGTGAASAKYYNSAVLQFNGSFAENTVITFEEGLIIYNTATKTAYRLSSNFDIAFVSNTWNVVKGSVNLSGIGWGNNTLFQIGSVKIDVDSDATESSGNTTNNLSYGGKIVVNGTAITMTLKYFNDSNILMFSGGDFTKNDILVISKGLIICQTSTKRAYVTDSDVYLIYNGGAEAGSWQVLSMAVITVDSVNGSSTAGNVKLNVTGLPNGTVDCTLANISGDNGAVTVTATCESGVLTITGEFGETFTLKSGSVFKVGDNYYILSGNDVALIYSGDTWGSVTGVITITSAGYTTSSVIQISQTLDFEENTVNTSGVKAEYNGETFTSFTMQYWSSSVLQFNISTTGVKGDILTIKGGSIFAQNGKFYKLDSDVNFMLVEKNGSLEWSYVKLFAITGVHWGNSSLVQVLADWGVDTAKGDTNLSVDYSGAQFTFSGDNNGAVTTVVYQAGTKKLQPHFTGITTDTIITIKKGSIFVFENVKYVLKEDFSCKWDGSNWVAV